MDEHELIFETELGGLKVEVMYELDRETRRPKVYAIRILTFEASHNWQIIRLDDDDDRRKVARELDELLERECYDDLNEQADEALQELKA